MLTSKSANNVLSLAGLFSFAALLPILAAKLLRVPIVALDNFTDAVFYLSYARQFKELILRYGFPYYATRFGGILPDSLSGVLFGEINGILILRYFLAISVSVSLLFCFRKRYGILPGILASVLWCFNPAAIRLLCTTYVDSTSVPFLLLGCCIFASGWGRNFGAFISGVLVALAASAHLYAAFALFLLVPWFMGGLWEKRQEMLRSFIWMTVGFILTFAAGWFWYWVFCGMPALLSPTIEVLKDLGSGQAALWKKSMSLALRTTPAWFVPWILLIPISLCVFRGSFLLRGIALSLLASAGFFWGGDLFGSAYVISMPFYYSFLLPVTILAAATLFGELSVIQRSNSARLAIFFGVIIGVVAPSLIVSLRTLTTLDVGIVLSASILILTPFWQLIQRRVLAICSILGMGLASVLVVSTGMFSQMLGHYNHNDIPVLELALALRHELPKASDSGSVMRFWYNDDLGAPGGPDRRMIESFWLHPFGKLIGVEDGFVPFPAMSPSEADAVTYSGVDRIVVMDQNPEQVSKALNVLKERAIPFLLSRRFVLVAGSDSSRTMNVAVLDRVNVQKSAEATPYDLNSIQIIHGGKIYWSNGIAKLQSGRFKAWDFAKIPLGEFKKGETLHIRFRVEEGNIRFALNDEKTHLFEHVEKWPTAAQQEVVLTAPDELGGAWLSLHSMYPAGSHSTLTIGSIFRD